MTSTRPKALVAEYEITPVKAAERGPMIALVVNDIVALDGRSSSVMADIFGTTERRWNPSLAAGLEAVIAGFRLF